METTPTQYPQNQNESEILDVKGVAHLLRVTEKTVYRRVKAGLMPHRKFGPRLIRFTREDVLGSMVRRSSRAEILA
jgi:excisionase family DNA binding protein